ncbi:sigma-54-dependent transcriptional regulator [Rhodospirillum centenum]|uniref:Transcriptional regulatory protein ZraR n=1 Tax=Rhodospirillum centenum (strain ATCC 51521 / SW) TaxID=414684 RepID=B6IQ78_RHOCS|nr:sigma-54 dependent transcriptional regulator [Rhodospirillum centenum]ACI97614.1 transcriptional regulatory protein ZraR [Rhodospirillum centenum SW]
MARDPHRILIVEPSAALAQAFVTALRRDGHALDQADSIAAALDRLAAAPADLVLLNLQVTDRPGLDGLKALCDRAARIIALTAQGSVQAAVEIMRAGAVDVLLLPVGTEKLRGAVTAALEAGPPRLQGSVGPLQSAPPSPLPGPAAPAAAPAGEPLGYLGFIGLSPQMQAVYRMIDAAAPSKATVFITGESGTGKEVCAESIHRRSPRTGGPFVAINCAAIPKDLMESEIFGHVKGAFTGATADHAGAALQAHGGTLFLDEICEMDLALQAKLLRFLQTGMVKKVGSEKLEPVDVRIVCATNRDPYAEVQAGRFREDLFYRLQVISIELPPLRDRGDDVLLIARQFLIRFNQEERKRFRGFSLEAERILRDYAWPGNVRQLHNVVRNVVVLNEGEEIQPFMLPPPLNKPTMIVPPMLSDPRWAAVAGPLAFQFGGGPKPPGLPTMPGLPGFPPAPAPADPVPQPDRETAAVPAPPDPVPAPAPQSLAAAFPPEAPERRIRPLWQVEQDAIDEAIRLCGGNITRAAALLEINPCTIYRRRQRKRAAL